MICSGNPWKGKSDNETVGPISERTVNPQLAQPVVATSPMSPSPSDALFFELFFFSFSDFPTSIKFNPINAPRQRRIKSSTGVYIVGIPCSKAEKITNFDSIEYGPATVSAIRRLFRMSDESTMYKNENTSEVNSTRGVSTSCLICSL